MRKTLNKLHRGPFAEAFMRAWRSPGIGLAKKDTVYGQHFILTEFRHSWRLSVSGFIERFVNLSDVGYCLFDELFDEKEVYIHFKPMHKAILLRLAGLMKLMAVKRSNLNPHNKDSYAQITNCT